MEKRRLSLNRTGGAKNYNSPMKGGPYSAHPVHYKMIEDIHLDLDAMDNEIDKALNSTSTKVRQVAHSFTVLQSIYFNTDTGKWALAQADDKDTIGTHIVAEVIDKDYFVAGLSGIFEVKNTLELGYWFTSDSVPGELIDTAPDINNPMIQVIDSNSVRVLDIGVVDNLDSIPASNVIVTDTVTPDFTPAVQGNNLQQVTNKVAGLQERLLAEINPSGVNGVEVVFSENHMRLRVEICSVGDNTGTTTALRWTINNVVSEIYNTTSLNKYAFFQMTLGRHGNSSMFIDMFVANSAIHAKIQSQITSAADYATTSTMTRNGNTISNAEFAAGINKINFLLAGTTFEAGSNIKIYKLP